MYFGETISEDELQRRYPHEDQAKYVMQRLRVYVDAAHLPEALARYANHSSRHNQLVLTMDSQQHGQEPFIVLEQRRPIEAGQQIWVNYGTGYFRSRDGTPIDRGFDY